MHAACLTDLSISPPLWTHQDAAFSSIRQVCRSSSLLSSISSRRPTSMLALPMTDISPHMPLEMPQRKLGDAIAPSLYTSASCMDLRPRRDDDAGRQWRSDQQLQPPSYQPYRQQPQRVGQLPHSSPLPQTQWTDVPPVYRPRNWVDPEEVSPTAVRQSQRADPMSAWRARPPPPPAPANSRHDGGTTRKRKAPRIFRRQDTAESAQQQQPFDATMLYPEMSPYDSSRMSVYSAPENMQHSHSPGFLSQPNSPGFAPSWSALPSRSEEPSPIGIPRSPTYPPAGRRRMHSTTGVGDAAFDDEHDFRLFVEATAGLPPEVGFSRQSPTTSSQSPRRRATTQGRQDSLPTNEFSPTAETPSTMFALQQLASIPQANQTYRPYQQSQISSRSEPQPQPQLQPPPSRPQATRSGSSRDRLAASASGLDLWLPSPISPQSSSHQPQTTHQHISRRPVGSSSSERPATVSSRAYPDISPLTPALGISGLDREIERQLEELELEEEDEGEQRDWDDELPDYAQSQAEAQAERRAEAARRAQELQERWLRRGRS